MGNLSKTFGKLTIPLLLLLTICFFNLPAYAKYGGGTGGPNDPYLIFDANQMNAIGADSNDWDKHFLLCADINLSVFTGTAFNIIGKYVNWYSPDNKPFTGVFDGSCHTISNFSYTTTAGSSIGLFRLVDGENAEIKNLGLIGPNVDAGTRYYVGSLVGSLKNGTINSCYVEGGSVTGGGVVGGLVGCNGGRFIGGTITSCYSTASVTGDDFVGGLVGDNHGTITNCYSTATVSGNSHVGGLVGENGGWIGSGTITKCYSSGSISGNEYVGGLVGWNFEATITSCYSTGSVSGNDNVGGLVGDNGAWYLGGSTITNCYSTGSVVGMTNVGGLVGFNEEEGEVIDSFWDIETSGQSASDGGTGKTTAEMQMASTFFVWACGDTVWTINESLDYPRLAWQNKPGELITIPPDLYGGGSGDLNDPYLIYTAEQLNTIGLIPCDLDKNFLLCADIDLSGFSGTEFNIIGYFRSLNDQKPFAGVFDGNGHTISNFSYTSTGKNEIGLFGTVYDPNAEIKNLGLIDPNVDAGTGHYVGSLVGWLFTGTITNCYSTGSVTGDLYVGGLVGMKTGTINNCYSQGSVSGRRGVGGLVGRNSGPITNCYSTASALGSSRVGGLVGTNGGTITSSYSTSSVSGNDYVGGLLGSNGGTINNCYAAASVWGDVYVGGLAGINVGTITACYSTGGVTGNNNVGGLVGQNGEYACDWATCWWLPGSISNCYSTASVTGDDNVGGVVGHGYRRWITFSFWDTQTSGQSTSDGGTGLPTAEMQTMSTFTDAGWDFVGETFNGIEDIWFIPQQDYPHLWWEGMQIPMKLTPPTLNCRSQGNWVKAHLTLPEGFTVTDVDPNRPAVLHSFGFQSAPLYVFVNENELVQIEASFEREQVCSLTGDWPEALTVVGFLTDGNIFLGSSTVRMITPGAKDIEELSLYWLNADCVHPDFCDGVDMNRDSLVNLPDYALFLNSQVEFVSE